MKLGRGRALRATERNRVTGLIIHNVVPVSPWHKQSLSRQQDHPVALSLSEPRKTVEVRIVHVNIATTGEWVTVQIARLGVGEKRDGFLAEDRSVEDVRHVDVEMHLGDGASAAKEHEHEVPGEPRGKGGELYVVEKFRNL